VGSGEAADGELVSGGDRTPLFTRAA